MNRICELILLSAFVLLLGLAGAVTPSLEARPQFLELFQADPFRNAAVDGCGTCHIAPGGGGARNDFGQAFAANDFSFTPMMRTQFPDHFDLNTVELTANVRVYLSDPDGRSVVVETGEEKRLVEIPRPAAPEGVAEATVEDAAPGRTTTESSLSFFVTSSGLGTGGNLGGLAGADRHCQMLAESAGAGSRTWRAYLSTSLEDAPAVHAGDRIGGGPWHNAKRVLIARGVAGLNSENSHLNAQTALTESGEPIPSDIRILTGSLPDGSAAIGRQCENWTSDEAGTALFRNGDVSSSCSQEDVGDARFYCFATD